MEVGGYTGKKLHVRKVTGLFQFVVALFNPCVFFNPDITSTFILVLVGTYYVHILSLVHTVAYPQCDANAITAISKILKSSPKSHYSRTEYAN